jgi:hypothetical protein
MPKNVVTKGKLIPLIDSYENKVLSSDDIKRYSLLIENAASNTEFTKMSTLLTLNATKLILSALGVVNRW